MHDSWLIGTRRGRARRPIAALLLGLTLLSNGCYRYVPAPDGVPGPGSRVRLRLSEPRDVRLTDVSANDVVLVNGEVVRADADTVIISAFRVQSQGGYEQVARGETVAIPAGEVVSVERNAFSVERSLGVAAITAALIAAISVALSNVGGSETGDGPPPVTQ